MRIADMHCDTISKIYEARGRGEKTCLRANNLSVDLEGMREAGYLLQFFACFVDMAKYGNPYEALMGMIDIFDGEIEKNADLIGGARRFEDIERNMGDGRMSALLTLEEGGALGGSMERLYEAYARGVRLITLTWNYENELGYPNYVGNGEPLYGRARTDSGLKPRGVEFLREMERLHIIADVSHLGDAGFYDVAANTSKPFLASHSNARAVTPHVRNLTDDMIRLLAKRGGILGINFCPIFLCGDFTSEEDCVSRVSDMVRHALHIREVGGIEVMGLGSDLDGIGGRPEIAECPQMELLGEALHSGGFSYDEVDLITHGNVLRFLRDVL
ncbi:MAG: dipeptidase [Butyrivibrio sp.]|nr:dipeptidase [Butyrivibrio sp.]